tara:strand:- start:1 stop:255 length:255 start_codon:yes stop_codon:yes gene_type:complete
MNAYPKLETLKLRLKSGKLTEVESVRVTTLDSDRGLLRVEWFPRASIQDPDRIIYGKRWEGSRRMLTTIPSEKNTWLLGVIDNG